MSEESTLQQRLEADGIEHLWVIYHDYSARSCTKVVPKEKFRSVIERGVVFARANLSMRMDDHQPDNATFLADTGDFLAMPDPTSYARVPYHESTARVHAFMRADDGSPWDGCPRTRLAQTVRSYAQRGFSLRVGFEPEVMLFQPGIESDYVPADTDGMFTVRSLDRHYGLWQAVISDLREMGITVDQIGKEYGPGQYEGTTGHGAPVVACDNYLTYKEVVKARAGARDLVASFMPKPYADLPGCGLHVHMSLWDPKGQAELSSGVRDDEVLSRVGRQMVAGLLAHAPALSGVGCPIVNSYKRLQPGSWAPAHVFWGLGNRAALVRVPGSGERRHIEYRSGDNAANPFVYLIALLAAGLDGIANEMEPPEPVDDVDVGHLSAAEVEARGLEFLPRNLAAALDALDADPVLTGALGPVIATEHVKVKRSELAAYDLHVHPWERQMYLEAL